MALALAAVLVAPGPAVAALGTDPSPYVRYVQGRVADADGRAADAAADYAAVLDAAPDETLLAMRAYRQAMVAGDRALALRAARILDAKDDLPFEGQLLLYSDGIARSDWAAVRTALARIETQKAFAFTLPVLRAWQGVAAGDPDPLALLKLRGDDKTMAAYVAEHRILILLALDRPAEAQAALDRAAPMPSGREARLARIVRFSRDGRGFGSGRSQRVAFGLSELYLRLAVDFNREKMTALAVILSQMAVMTAPDHAEARLAAAQLLSLGGRKDAALALLDQMKPGPAMVAAVRTTRVRILLLQDKGQEALEVMQPILQGATASATDWTLIGDIQSRLGKLREAADAYGQAIARLPEGDDQLPMLYLRQGSALEELGDWPSARQALERAVALAPDQPFALNYLGYSQIVRRENLPAARALIDRAIALDPDDPAIVDSLGWAAYLQGDLDGAIVRLESAVEKAPDSSEINEHLGDAYWSAGRRVEARYAWSAALIGAKDAMKQRLDRKIDMGLRQDEQAP